MGHMIFLFEYFILINVLSSVMLSLIDLLKNGRNEDSSCEEAYKKQADQVQSLLDSPHVP
jgi:hypothetical protein